MIAVNTDGSAARERRFLDWSLRGTIDGVVGVFFKLRAPDLTPLAQAGVCVVRIETSAKRGGALPIDNLFVDNVAAAGAKPPAISSNAAIADRDDRGQWRPGAQSDRRLSAGFGEVGPDAQGGRPRRVQQEGGYRAARDVLRSVARRPTAIFAGNDLMALGAMAAIREVGLSNSGRHRVDGLRRHLCRQRRQSAALDRQPAPVLIWVSVAAEMLLERLNELACRMRPAAFGRCRSKSSSGSRHDGYRRTAENMEEERAHGV